MGPYLTTPKKEKEVENGEGTKVRIFKDTHNTFQTFFTWHK